MLETKKTGIPARKKQGYFLGLDIGSVNAKSVLIDESARVVRSDIERVTTGPRAAVVSLLSRLSEEVNLDEIVSAGVSGSGKSVIPKQLNWTEYSSPLAIISGLLSSHPDAKTIVQIGGQSSLVIELEDGLKKPWKVSSNPLCAAGTGRFLEQQAYRLGISLEDFSRLALKAEGSAPRIAARCSVFAKTDLIHLQQKGAPVESILSALADSVARMVASFKKGAFEAPVYLVGGVAANDAVLRSLNEAVSARNGHRAQAIVPEGYLHIEAQGLALLARESGRQSKVIVLQGEGARQRYFIMPKLEQSAVGSRQSAVTREGRGTIDYRLSTSQDSSLQPLVGYLGVDVGSTSTKAVILDESGKTVIAKNYLMTAGRPLDAVKEVFRNLREDMGDSVTIAGVGVTGSGRYLVGSFIGADLIKNEITAQTRAAEELDPEADIIEVGGQDSKLIIKRNGVVVDYQMNKACAAGTGSFIDELAEMLDVSVKDGRFASLAFQAPYTIDLGSRCAAFMGQAVACAQQEGVPIEVITASLSNSIAHNYLSKVVEMRRLGEKVILTGAVFYNDAVVSAFQRALEGKKLIVPEHKEVTGAIGAALLAKEEMVCRESKFKGFRRVVEGEYTLKSFTCNRCDNNCTISRLELAAEPPTFYGSRCDLYDSTISFEKKETAVDEREKLLFKDYNLESRVKSQESRVKGRGGGLQTPDSRLQTGSGLTVGIPRSLLMYDYAPLFVAFLNALGVKVVLSRRTNRQTIEQSVELSYTDSCFPIKLVYGHAAGLRDTNYIVFPSAIRLGRKEGDENQKYACPLVQAAPFLVREALGMGKKLLIPFIDFSTGDDEVIDSLARMAMKMGFSKKRGKTAALAGLSALREFERAREERGRALLEQIRQNNQIGVVLLGRSYVYQDSGANLGVAEQLARLGVVPIPLDFLPLSSIDATKYSDRPYWLCESKLISGAAIVASDPRLYGLILTNFGCGPNSFILPIVEDIMGGKPLGQLEIDEHAAEAGIVTRLEAFVDTIKDFGRSGKAHPVSKDSYRKASTLNNSRGILLLNRMAPHADLLAAAMKAFGVEAIVLPPSDETSLLHSNKVTSGTECLPYRVTLGDFMRFYYEHGTHGIDLNDVEGFMAGAFGPCRLGKYALEQGRILREIGFDLPIRTSVSNNAYRDWGLGSAFVRLAWRGIVAMDYLQKLLWRTRPYEKTRGTTDALFEELSGRIADRIRRRQSFDDILIESVPGFRALIDHDQPRRPLVGINGEIFLRSNDFSNSNLVRTCEDAGLEVVVSPFGEWIKYLSLRNIEDGVKDRRIVKIIKGYFNRLIQNHDEKSVLDKFAPFLDIEEPTIREILSFTKPHLSPRCGSEAVLSTGTGIEWMENSSFAGVVSVMPHGCMPGGIVAAMSENISAKYGKPWINLTYDGSLETNNLVKINNFAEVLRFSRCV
ncbi:MAG: 2-hydroxyisocaproyl-CoA dehydratase activator [Dehalococcoidia bacterium]|nr:2-hydroxyisocaproyl-CoA dehydratase activator [Chloroflexota bacterium]